MNSSKPLTIVLLIVSLLAVFALMAAVIVFGVRMIRRSKQPANGTDQLHSTGNFAFGLGILQILVIPVYYPLLKSQPHITQQELVDGLIGVAIYQLIIGMLLIVQGRKLRGLTATDAKAAKKALKWLTAVVIIGLVSSLVNVVTGGGGGANILLIFLAISIASSWRSLKGSVVTPQTPPMVTPTNPPTPPTITPSL